MPTVPSAGAPWRSAPSWSARILGCGAPALAASGPLEGALIGLYSVGCLWFARRPLAWLRPWLPACRRPAAVLMVTGGAAAAVALVLQVFDARLGTALAPGLALAAVNPLLWLGLLDGCLHGPVQDPGRLRRQLRQAALLLFLVPLCAGGVRALPFPQEGTDAAAYPVLSLLAVAAVAAAWNASGARFRAGRSS